MLRSSTKSLVSMLKHLSGKWARAVPPQGAQCMFVHPSHDCPITLRGMKWGGPMCDPQLKVRPGMGSSGWVGGGGGNGREMHHAAERQETGCAAVFLTDYGRPICWALLLNQA